MPFDKMIVQNIVEYFIFSRRDPKIFISGEHEAVPWLRVIQSRPAPAATFVSCSGFGQKNVVRNGSSRQGKTEI